MNSQNGNNEQRKVLKINKVLIEIRFGMGFIQVIFIY